MPDPPPSPHPLPYAQPEARQSPLGIISLICAIICLLTLCFSIANANPFALVLKTPNTTLRIQKVKTFTPHPFTALGWTVDDIRATAQQLAAKGIQFERFPGMTQDDLGIWLSPSGAKVCWFKDPDGNILSLTQFPDGINSNEHLANKTIS